MKHVMLAGYFNMNVLEYEYNKKAKRFFNVMYQRNLVLTINKSRRIGRNSDFETAILKTDVTDHFPVVITMKIYGPSQQSSKTKHPYNRNYDEENIKDFNQRLLMINWDGLKNCDDRSETYKRFFNIFNPIYDIYFQKIQ